MGKEEEGKDEVIVMVTEKRKREKQRQQKGVWKEKFIGAENREGKGRKNAYKDVTCKRNLGNKKVRLSCRSVSHGT